MYGGPEQPAFVSTINAITGIVHSPDLNGGDPNCVAYTPDSLNIHENDNRSSSATAYLSPVEYTRTNWLTLVDHQVTTLLWNDNTTVARGVRFRQSDGSSPDYNVYARKEIILAAGAINTPKLLQLSGVGDPALLDSLGIPVVISITTVGRNLQEQTRVSMGAGGNFDRDGAGPSDVIAYPNLYQLFGDQANATASTIRDSLSAWADSQKGNALSSDALQTIYQIQADLILNYNGALRSSNGYESVLMPSSSSCHRALLRYRLPQPDRGRLLATSSFLPRKCSNCFYQSIR